MRRSVRSLLPTIAVFLASIQAARAGAGVEAGTLPTPAHHRGATNGPVRPAALSVRASTFAVGTVMVATSAMIRRTGQVDAPLAAVADSGQRANLHRAAVRLTGSVGARPRATSRWRRQGVASERAVAARQATLGRGRSGVPSQVSVPKAQARAVALTAVDAPHRSAAPRVAVPERAPSGATHLYGTVRARAPCGVGQSA